MRALGFPPSVHAWIMSSLKTTAQGSTFAFDLDGSNCCCGPSAGSSQPRAGAEELFADYCRADFWHVVGACVAAVLLPSCARAPLSSVCLSTQNPLPRAHLWPLFALKTEDCRWRAHCKGLERLWATSETAPKLFA